MKADIITSNYVTSIDRPIDRIVYPLYGLTDEEIAVVEGRLKHE